MDIFILELVYIQSVINRTGENCNSGKKHRQGSMYTHVRIIIAQVRWPHMLLQIL